MRSLKTMVRLIYTRPDVTQERIAADAGYHVHTVQRYRRLLLTEGRDRWHWGKLKSLSSEALYRELNRQGQRPPAACRSPIVASPDCGKWPGSIAIAFRDYRRSAPNPCSYSHFVRQLRAQQALASGAVPKEALDDDEATALREVTP